MPDNVVHIGGRVSADAMPTSAPPEVIVPVHKELHVAAARFRHYCETALKAQRTMDLQDGIAAGRAWASFLQAFELPPPEKTPA
ncbi:MAG: hypothetical protein J0H17_13895 [Rhizobiales bacterium]|nr:hypothetical protein [Hyphomicrobiales bacterium]